MEAERWKKVQEIFDQAVELSGEERSALLDSACAGDHDLRSEIDAMLDVDDTLSVDCLETVVMGGSALLTETFDPILRRGSIGKYKIIEKVGEGGFGMVHRGVDQDLKRDVAIKTCTSSDERLRLRFQREAEISARLQHPNITTVHDLGIEDGIPYLVQEFLIGEDLSDKIERKEPLDTSTRLDYLLQIARGLTHAHKHGVLHRDVKPGNMRVLDNGRLKILDFGIARLVDESNPITTEGEAVGTVGYLSPEQFEGTGVDRRSDIFSFGVVAYELLTQTRPFPGKTFSEVSYKLMYEAPQPMGELWPDCPVTLAHLVSRCLEKDKDNRYQSFHELTPVLEEVIRQLDDDHQGKTPLATVGQEAERRHRNRWLIMAAGLFGLLALLVVSLFFGPATDNGSADVQASVDEPGELAALTIPDEPTIVTRPDEARPEETGSGEAGPEEPLTSTTETPTPPRPDASESTNTSRDNSSDPKLPTEPSRSGVESATIPPSPQPANDLPTVDEPQIPSPETQEGGDATATPPEDPEATSAEVPLESTSDPGNSPNDAQADVPGSATKPSTEETTTAPSEPPQVDADPSETLAATEAAGPAETMVEPPAERLPVIEFPSLIRQGEAIYPRRAYQLKIEAQVTVGIYVDEHGNVTQTTLVHCSTPGMGFEAKAQKAAKKSKYRRGTQDGVPTPMWTELTYDFKYQ